MFTEIENNTRQPWGKLQQIMIGGTVMTITITDHADRPITPSQLPDLALWNDTMSHICATVIIRATQEDDQSQAS